MENILRMAIVFVWSMFFGFFSVMGFIDETMAGDRKALILLGLLVALGVYLAFEWFTRKSDPEFVPDQVLEKKPEDAPVKKELQSQLDERVLRRLKLYTKDHEQELEAALTPEPPRKRKKPALSSSKR